MPKDDPLNDMPKASEDIIKSKKGTYEVLEILGKGSFGAVFRVRRLEDNKELAMKCESYKVKKQILRHEARVLEGLRRISSVHFISYEDRGKISGRFMFVVLRLVGKNLWDLRMESVDRRFSMSTAIRAAEQTLSGIRDVHICGFLHRDIKPPNFAIGREEDNLQQTIYILDFGLCRRYRKINAEGTMSRHGGIWY
uniref:Protein kinase domain-containing protein n=1 Tax=Haemonchus contortus TaxID=6289 RepID=A0A7I4XSW2_HAECO